MDFLPARLQIETVGIWVQCACIGSRKDQGKKIITIWQIGTNKYNLLLSIVIVDAKNQHKTINKHNVMIYTLFDLEVYDAYAALTLVDRRFPQRPQISTVVDRYLPRGSTAFVKNAVVSTLLNIHLFCQIRLSRGSISVNFGFLSRVKENLHA